MLWPCYNWNDIHTYIMESLANMCAKRIISDLGIQYTVYATIQLTDVNNLDKIESLEWDWRGVSAKLSRRTRSEYLIHCVDRPDTITGVPGGGVCTPMSVCQDFMTYGISIHESNITKINHIVTLMRKQNKKYILEELFVSDTGTLLSDLARYAVFQQQLFTVKFSTEFDDEETAQMCYYDEIVCLCSIEDM